MSTPATQASASPSVNTSTSTPSGPPPPAAPPAADSSTNNANPTPASSTNPPATLTPASPPASSTPASPPAIPTAGASLLTGPPPPALSAPAVDSGSAQPVTPAPPSPAVPGPVQTVPVPAPVPPTPSMPAVDTGSPSGSTTTAAPTAVPTPTVPAPVTSAPVEPLPAQPFPCLPPPGSGGVAPDPASGGVSSTDSATIPPLGTAPTPSPATVPSGAPSAAKLSIPLIAASTIDLSAFQTALVLPPGGGGGKGIIVPPTVTPATVKDTICVINIPEDELRIPISLERAICAAGAPISLIARSLGQKLSQFWDYGQQITYSFISGTPNQQSKVIFVINNLNFVTLSFVQVAQDGMIRISFDPNQGSWSYVGNASLKVPSPRPTMNLGAISDNATFLTASAEYMLILHELGHVLGLYHEHPSPATGGSPTLDAEPVYAYFKYTMGWDRAIVKTQVLDVYNLNSITNYMAPDNTSVMRFFMPAALTVNNTPGPSTSAAQYNPSNLDLGYLLYMYPPLPAHWSTDAARVGMAALGIDAATVNAYFAAYAVGNVVKYRALIQAFMLTARSTAAV